jgi:hypothetical protein
MNFLAADTAALIKNVSSKKLVKIRPLLKYAVVQSSRIERLRI